MSIGIAIKSDSLAAFQIRSLRKRGADFGNPADHSKTSDLNPLEHVPTSRLIRSMLADVSPDRVTLAWLLNGLQQRSFGMVMLILGIIAMIPAICNLAGIAVAALGFQMLMGHTRPVLPGFIARRPLPIDRVGRLMRRTAPAIEVLEKIIRPRWYLPFLATQRLVGLVILTLAATLFLPVPLSNVIPGAAMIGMALAYLEEDGVLLGLALVAAMGSLLITAAEAWVAIEGAHSLMRT